jgi:hypothetical protein
MSIEAQPAPDSELSVSTPEMLRQDFVDALREKAGSPEAPSPFPLDSSADLWSYQELFRALGAILDQDNTGRISIVEVEDGFLLRRQRYRHTLTETALSHLSRETLRLHAEQLRLDVRGRWVRQRSGLWNRFPFSHQDFFRALGHELDQAGARHVVIDELSEGLLVTFEQAGPDGAPNVARRMVLTNSEIENILNAAVDRRGAPDGAGDTTASGRPLPPLAAVPEPAWSLPRDGLPYQEMLRSIGRALDRGGVERVCLLEVPDGMTVRHERGEDHTLVWNCFTDDQIVEGSSLRRKLGFLRPHPGTPSRYSDLFRALGYELQRGYACNIMIVEQNDGFVVSYEFPDPRRSLTLQRAMLFLGETEQRELRQQARGRRQRDPHFLARLTRRA